MCGICGYIGGNPKQNVIEKLSLLEYRGYDSCGVGFFSGNKIKIIKSTKKIDDLSQKIKNEDIKNLVIGHTRWATHGEPSEINAHPHISPDGRWAVVHNGIIENHDYLKKRYLNGTNFYSQTDSEVIPCLLSKNDNNILSFITVCNMLKGSFAICAINNLEPDRIYVAKNQSPIYVGIKSGEALCASDTYCFKDYPYYYSLEDGEFALLKKDKVTFFDKTGKIILKNPQNVKKENDFLYGKKVKYFMEKEINEIPFAIKNLREYYLKNGVNISFCKDDIDRIMLVGCGSAYHSALIGEFYLKSRLGIEVTTHIASEFRYSDHIISPKTLCIFVSQSGETADTIASLKMVKGKCHTLAIVNNEHSTLSLNCDNSMYMLCGREVAVCTTKAFVNGTLALYILANYLTGDLCKIKRLSLLEKNIKDFLLTDNVTEQIAEKLKDKKDCFFIGRNIDYPLQMEAGLKLKEICYINCLSIPSGELKHGSLALIENNTICFASVTQKRLLEKNLGNISEVKARGGDVYLVTTNKTDYENKIEFKHINSELDVIELSVFYQLIAYKVRIKKGLSPDKPRNLAKSVTVE